MLKLAVVKITEDTPLSLSLPLSAIDYINSRRGRGYLERAVGMSLLSSVLASEGIYDFKLRVTPTGKPYLQDMGLYFSISHSEGLCALVLSDTPCGIDLQELSEAEKISNRDKFAQRYFAPEELSLYKAEPGAEQICRIWTRKEALAKLLGVQLNSALSGLSSFSRRSVKFEARRGEVDGKTYFLTVAKEYDKDIKGEA